MFIIVVLLLFVGVSGLGVKCDKEISCRECARYLFLCKGRKKERVKNILDVKEIFDSFVLCEHT